MTNDRKSAARNILRDGWHVSIVPINGHLVRQHAKAVRRVLRPFGLTTSVDASLSRKKARLNTKLRSGLAAVHTDDLAGDERRLAGSDEHDGICDLRGGSRTLERYSRDQPGLPLGGAGEPIKHSGFDRTGRDGVDANA